MSNGSNNSKKSTILTALLALFVILSIALFMMKQSSEAALTQEKELVMQDLSNLQSEYDKVVSENSAISSELASAKSEIASFIDSIAGLNADVASLKKFRSRYYAMKKQKEDLAAKIAELEAANAKLTIERDETFAALEKQNAANEELLAQNIKLAGAVERGSVLVMGAYSAQGVREKSNGSYKSTSRASSADGIQICFTVVENAIANTGERKLYLEVIGADGAVINSQSASNADGASINYSKVTAFSFEGMSIDVCDYVKADNLIKGDYMVNAYDENLHLLGTSSVTLK